MTLDAALRAHGITLPGRFRVEVFEACAGTTLPTLARLEKILGPSATHGAHSHLHPLTRANATALLREPRSGWTFPHGSFSPATGSRWGNASSTSSRSGSTGTEAGANARDSLLRPRHAE